MNSGRRWTRSWCRSNPRCARHFGRRAKQLHLDAEDIEHTAYIEYARTYGSTAKTPDEQRMLLNTIASHYVARCFSRACSERSVMIEWSMSHEIPDAACDSSVIDHEERQRRDQLLRQVMPLLTEVLRSLPYFKSTCYVMHKLLKLEYAHIASTFEVAVRGYATPQQVKDAIGRAIAQHMSATDDPALPTLAALTPANAEIVQLAAELANQGAEYWHYRGNAHSRLRGWAHRVHKDVTDFLDQRGIHWPT